MADDRPVVSGNAIAKIVAVVLLVAYCAIPFALLPQICRPEEVAKPISYQLVIDGQYSQQQATEDEQGGVESAPTTLKSEVHEEGRATPVDDATERRNVRWLQRFSCEFNIGDFSVGLFTLLLGIATFFLWRETERLALGAETQASREVTKFLPYVQVSEAQFEWLPGPAHITVTVQNSGQMPAKWFEVMYASESIKKGDKWSIPTNLKSDIWSNLAGSGATLTARLHDAGFATNAGINTNAVEDRNFFLLGKVRYADIWDNEYETEFVFFTPDARPTIEQNGGGPRRMSRPTGKLASFVKTKQVQ